MSELSPHIEVSSTTYIRASKPDMLPYIYDVDRGPLAVPKEMHERLGAGVRLTGSSDIRAYGDLVPDYDKWLRRQIQIGNAQVMEAMDQIFNMALDKGCILVTSRHLTVAVTHAHAVMKIIMELAGQLEE